MHIKGKGIRSLSKYLPQIGDGMPFRVGIPIKGNEVTLKNLGFPTILEVGMSILPAVVGKVSKFNSEGREKVRKDLTKIAKSRMVYTSWNDWHGYPHSGIQYRDYMVYPKEHIKGPEEEITLLQRNTELIAVSEEMTVKSGDDSRALHAINLFLEYFGECELLDKDISPIIKVRKVHWQILPPGEYPWAKVKPHLQAAISRLGEKDQPVVEHRFEHIARHKPDLVAVGTGGFGGYFVFGFVKKGLFVLESTHLDNATYVMKSDWQNISRLSKSEIIAGQLHDERLIHNRGWYQGLRNVIG